MGNVSRVLLWLYGLFRWLYKQSPQPRLFKEANMPFVAKSKKTKSVRSYTNGKGVKFQRGDTVRLRRGAFSSSDPTPPLFLGKRVTQGKIVALLPDLKGCVQVSPRLGGYWTWSVDDLEIVK